MVSQDTHTGDSFTLNTAVVINLACTLSSHSSWSAENIQLSDLSLWTDIPNDHYGWAKGSLPGVLGTYFGTCVSNFSKGIVVHAIECCSMKHSQIWSVPLHFYPDIS